MRKFSVNVSVDAILEIDEEVFAQVDDEWRYHLYDLETEDHIVAHIAFNLLANGLPLNRMDGWANLDPNMVELKEADWMVNTPVELKESHD